MLGLFFIGLFLFPLLFEFFIGPLRKKLKPIYLKIYYGSQFTKKRNSLLNKMKNSNDFKNWHSHAKELGTYCMKID